MGSKYPNNCPAGTFNPSTEKSKPTDCLSCTAGFYCAGSTELSPSGLTGPCKDGYYCTGGSKIPNQFAADPGYFAKAGYTNQAKCLAGTYNPFVAQKECQGCPAGYKCSTQGMSTLEDCPAGSYCPANSFAETKCDPGYFNDQTNGKSASDCK